MGGKKDKETKETTKEEQIPVVDETPQQELESEIDAFGNHPGDVLLAEEKTIEEKTKTVEDKSEESEESSEEDKPTEEDEDSDKTKEAPDDIVTKVGDIVANILKGEKSGTSEEDKDKNKNKDKDKSSEDLIKLESRLNDTRNYATQMQQQNIKLTNQLQQQGQQLQEISKALEKDGIKIEKLVETPETSPTQPQTKGKQLTALEIHMDRFDKSLSLADGVFGKSVVDEYVGEGGKYQKLIQENPQHEGQIRLAVSQAEYPVFEIISQVKNFEENAKSVAESEQEKVTRITSEVLKALGVDISDGGNGKNGGKGGNTPTAEKLATTLDELRSAGGEKKKQKEALEDPGDAYGDLPGSL
jgi:hypothetical protein